MLALLKCVGEAVAAKGIRGLADCVPGGPYLYDVSADALKRLKERRRHQDLREEIRTAAEASFEKVRAEAKRVVAEVAPNAPPTDKIALELYLSQVPGAVRRSLRCAKYPTGRTVPPSFSLNTPDDLMKVLPPQMPRFRAGDDVPGRLGWKLVEPLGAGGFGEVWRVENEENGRTYAVKFCTDATARHRLLKHEKELVRRVQGETANPHIVRLIDSRLSDEVAVPWLAYEYVKGCDLSEMILAWQNVPKEERTRKALGVLATLAATAGHFHAMNPPIVHRDLKPANILVNLATKKLQVTDFGIGGFAAANLLRNSRDGATAYARVVSMLSGAYTPLYASPQQRNGAPPDPRDDVHALGVIAYQMFTGRLDAVPGAKYERDLRKLGVPEDVITLIGDCVDDDTEGRPANGAAVRERLEAGTYGAGRRKKRDEAASQPDEDETEDTWADPRAEADLDTRLVRAAKHAAIFSLPACGLIFASCLPSKLRTFAGDGMLLGLDLALGGAAFGLGLSIWLYLMSRFVGDKQSLKDLATLFLGSPAVGAMVCGWFILNTARTFDAAHLVTVRSSLLGLLAIFFGAMIALGVTSRPHGTGFLVTAAAGLLSCLLVAALGLSLFTSGVVLMVLVGAVGLVVFGFGPEEWLAF